MKPPQNLNDFYNVVKMVQKSVYFFFFSVFLTAFYKSTLADEQLGSLTCTNGAWRPDPTLLGFGLKCPMPLDGTDKSKGKATACAFENMGLYDGKNTVKRDEIAPKICSVFTQNVFNIQCKEQVAVCLKNGDAYFKNPQQDPDYKTWAPPYKCMYVWMMNACKK